MSAIKGMMMGTLNKKIREHIASVPEIILKKKILEKLEEVGRGSEDLANAIVKHVISNGSDPFTWDDGDAGTQESLTIHISEEELADVMVSMKKFLENGIPEIVHSTLEQAAKATVRNLDKSWREVKLGQAAEYRYFQERLDLRWATGLDPLRMILIASREIGDEYVSRLQRSKAKRRIRTRETLAMLHVRACQTASEIVSLMESGFADGAYARWRTLYELSIVAMMISKFGDDLAERYLDHDIVSVREALIGEAKFNGEYDAEASFGKTYPELDSAYSDAISTYGKPFATPYGWAADQLKLKRPLFQDIEKSIDWDSLPPDYRWSSHKVHAGPSGLMRSLGIIGSRQVLSAGATNAGFEKPAINAAYSLLHVTSLLFDRGSDLDDQVQLQVLVILRDRVTTNCMKIARKLVREEQAQWSE